MFIYWDTENNCVNYFYFLNSSVCCCQLHNVKKRICDDIKRRKTLVISRLWTRRILFYALLLATLHYTYRWLRNTVSRNMIKKETLHIKSYSLWLKGINRLSYKRTVYVFMLDCEKEAVNASETSVLIYQTIRHHTL